MTSQRANLNPSENLVEEFHTPPGTPRVCPGTATSVEPGKETSILGSSMEDNGSNHKGNNPNNNNGKSKSTGSSSVTTLPGEKENVAPLVVVGGASGSSWVPADDEDEEMGIRSTGLGGESWNRNDESDDQPEPVFWIVDEPMVEAAEGQHSWMDQWKQVKAEATAAGLIQKEVEPKYLKKGAEDVQEGALVLSGEEEDEDGFVLISDDLANDALSESYDLVGDSCKTKQQ